LLLDSDNENDEEVDSKGEAFVEEKWFKFTLDVTGQLKHPFVRMLW